ncbi:MAG: endolytic transglycosylase MltG, partial [Bacteroidota bacterium]
MLRKLLLFFLVVLAIGGWLGYDKYQNIFAPNVPDQLSQDHLIIPTGSSYDDLFQLLKKQELIIDEQSFDWVAEQMSFKQKEEMRSGRFKIEPGWSNRRLIQHLRNGKQATVKVVLNNERLPEEVAHKVAKVIETDSADIHQLFLDESFLKNYDVNLQQAMSLLIPNTYDFYWNQSAKEFFDRMYKEHQNFWKKDKRLDKAKKLGLSPEEVYTLASIVERESLKKDERPR